MPRVRKGVKKMIYNMCKNFLFIHIPRCSGTSMSNALRTTFRDSLVNDDDMKHARVPRLKKMLGDRWADTYKFAVIRSPWEIIESYWRHTKLAYNEITSTTNPFWYNHVIEVEGYSGFQEYVEKQYVQPGNVNLRNGCGFWRTFCTNLEGNGEEGVHPVLISEVDEFWVKFCASFNIMDAPRYPRDNMAHYSNMKWTPQLIELIGTRCKDDIELFGFKEPI